MLNESFRRFLLACVVSTMSGVAACSGASSTSSSGGASSTSSSGGASSTSSSGGASSTSSSGGGGDGGSASGGTGGGGGSGPGLCNLPLATPGDLHPCINLVYPKNAMHVDASSTGRVIDVSMFGANGSDDLDDSDAFIAAYDFVINALAADKWVGFDQTDNKASYTLYIPDGTYRITKTIIYSGPIRFVPDGNGDPIPTAEALVHIRFIGQSREKTILQLASGTFDSKPGAVLSFGKQDFNNTQTSNAVRNLTIQVLPGNAKATGIYYGGANSADIDNVAVISEDRKGEVGIDNSIGTVVGPRRNITVTGFDFGFRTLPYHFTYPVLEHVTVNEQNVAGIELVDGPAAMRLIKSHNKVPAVRLSGAGSHAVVLDSVLDGVSGKPAIQIAKTGHVFARNIQVSGYSCGVNKEGACAVPGNVDEYVSDPVIAKSPTHPASGKSLSLPVEEAPLAVFDEGNVAQWVSPAYTLSDANKDLDASMAIQDAMDSGKPVVYFPAHTYTVNKTIDVPCTVRVVDGLFTELKGSAGIKFKVSAACPAAPPVLFKDFDSTGGTFVSEASMRTIVLSAITTQAFLYDNTVQPATGTPKLFGYMIGSIKSGKPFKNVHAFLRMASGENPNGTYVVDGNTSQVWLLGFKTEKAQETFTVQNGGTLEVLGGILNQYDQNGSVNWDLPNIIALQVKGATSRASFVACTNGPNNDNGFRTLIQDSSSAPTKTVMYDALPPRVGNMHQEIIPLYVSY